jgi:hypothetical protein
MVVKNVDEELAFLVEMECIDQLKKLGVNLCNMTNGGEGASGSKRSQETKNKLSAIRKNLPNSMLGKKHKTESRKKQSEDAKKRPKFKCLYCDMISIKGILTRFHNENCKHKLGV